MSDMKNTVYEDLQNIINETFKINKDTIDIETKLFSGGINLNSIQLIELTVSIENFYNKEFDSDMLVEDNFRDIQSLVGVIEKHFID